MALNMAGLGFVVAAEGVQSTVTSMRTVTEAVTQATAATTKSYAATEKWADAQKILDSFTTETVSTTDAVGDLAKTIEKSASETQDAHKELEQASETLEDVGDNADDTTKAVEKMNKSFASGAWDKLKSGSEAMGTLAANAARFIASMPQRALDGIARTVGSITNAAQNASGSLSSMPTGTLTTGREAELQRIAEGVRRVGVNYGFTGAALRRFTGEASSLADSLAQSPEQAAQAVRGFSEATSEMRAIGVRSAADVARIQAVFGISGDTLRNSLLLMRNELGFSDQSMNRLVGSIQRYGQESGDVTGAFQALPDLLHQLRTQASATGRQLSGDELEQYGSGVFRLARGFFQFTQDSTEARQMAMDFSRSLIDSERGIQNMVAGTEENLPQFIEQFAIAQGDISTIMQDMRAGPDGFIRAMARTAMSVREAGGPEMEERFNQLRARLEQAVGPEQAAMLTNFFRSADRSAIQSMTAMEGATSTLAQAAREGFSTGRTLSDNFERMQQGFIMGFRNIGRAAAGPFVAETGRAFAQFNATLRGVVDRGGPLADLVTAMSEASSIGASAFLPTSLRPMLPLLNAAREAAGPFVETLSHLGINLSALASPMGLVGAIAGGMGLWFIRLYERTGSVSAAFEEMGTKLQSLGADISRWASQAGEWLGTMTGRIAKWAEAFDWQGFFTTLIQGATRTMRSLFSGLGGLFGASLGDAVTGTEAESSLARTLGNLVRFVRPIVTGLLNALTDIDFGQLAAGAGGMTQSIGAGLVGLLRAIPVEQIGQTLVVLLRGALQFLSAQLPAVLGTLTTLMVAGAPILMGAAETLFREAINLLVDTDWAGLLTPVANALFDGLGAVMRVLPGLADRIITALTGGLDRLASGPLLGNLMGFLQSFLDRGLNFLVNDVLVGVVRITSRVLQALPGAVQSLLTMVGTLLRELPSRLMPLLSGLGQRLQAVLPGLVRELLDGLWAALSSIPGLIGRVLSMIPPLLAQMGPMLLAAGEMVKGAVLGLLDGLRDWLISKLPESAGTITTVFETLRTAFLFVYDNARAVLTGIWDFISGIASAIGRFVSAIPDALRSVGDSIMENFGGPIRWLQEAFGSVFQWITEKIAAVSGALQSVRAFFGGSTTTATPATTAPAVPPRPATTALPPRPATQTPATTQTQPSSMFSGLFAGLSAPSSPALSAGATRAVGQAATTSQATLASVSVAATQTSAATTTAFEGARDRINAALGTVRSTADGTFGALRLGAEQFRTDLTTWTTTFQAQMTTSLTTIFSAVSGIFRTNVLAVIQTGLDETFALLSARVALFTTELTGTLGLRIEDVISGGVARGLMQALRAMETAFVPRMVTMWETLTKRIGDLWAQKLLSIVTTTEAVLRYIGTQTDTLLQDINRASSVLQSLQTRADVTQANAGTSQTASQRRPETVRGLNDAERALFDAIHNPDWTTRYMEMFDDKMTRLISAVQGSTNRGGRTSPAASGAPDREAVVRQISALGGQREGGRS